MLGQGTDRRTAKDGEVGMNTEMVINGLEACIISATTDDCVGYGCPYYSNGNGECQNHMFSDVLELLKAQEPMVMTADEMRLLNSGDVVYLEDNDKPNVIAGIFQRVNMLITHACFITINGLILPDVKDDYGKRWRCWNKKPTDKQRQNTPWKE